MNKIDAIRFLRRLPDDVQYDIRVSINHKPVPPKLSRRQKKLQNTVLKAVCQECSTTIDDIFSKSRKAKLVEARKIAMYVFWHFYNLSESEIGDMVGKHRTTVYLHCNNVGFNRKLYSAFDDKVCAVLVALGLRQKSVEVYRKNRMTGVYE